MAVIKPTEKQKEFCKGLLEKPVYEVIDAIRDKGYEYRILNVNGLPVLGAHNSNEEAKNNRVNIHTMNGIISDVYFG